MNRTLTSPNRTLRALLAAGAFVALSAAPAQAQINFAGTTQFRSCGIVACAGPGGWSTTSLKIGANNKSLEFTNGAFNIMTSGTPAFSTGSIPGVTGNNLGSLHLMDGPYNFTARVVEMLVTLSNPMAPNQVFKSVLSGIINMPTNTPTQFVSISWQNAVTGVPFTNGPGTGTFDLSIDDVTMDFTNNLPDQYAKISGDVTVVTPEPASLALVATGLLGVIGVARRRRKA